MSGATFRRHWRRPFLPENNHFKGHGEALGEEMRKSWPTIRSIACLERRRDHVRKGRVIRTERETIYLITSLSGATPERIMSVNRGHWRIKAMHHDKDIT